MDFVHVPKAITKPAVLVTFGDYLRRAMLIFQRSVFIPHFQRGELDLTFAAIQISCGDLKPLGLRKYY